MLQVAASGLRATAQGIFDASEVINTPIDCAKPEKTIHDDAVFVSRSGSDISGDGTSDSPYGTVQKGISKLGVASQVCVEQGVYNERDIPVALLGSSLSKIQILSLGGDVLVDSSADVGGWRLIDARLNIYESIQDVGTGNLHGSFFDDHWHALTFYTDMDSFMSEIYHVSTKSRYVGPGIISVGDKIRLRSTPVPQSVMPCGVTTNLFDPNDIPARVSNCARTFDYMGSHVQFRGISTAGSIMGFELDSESSDLDIIDSQFYNNVGVFLREGADNVNVIRPEFRLRLLESTAWADMKGGDGQSIPAKHWTNRISGVSVESKTGGSGTKNLYVEDPIFERVLDGGVWSRLTGGEMKGATGTATDDLIQVGSDCNNIMVHDTGKSAEYLGAGPSHNGKGTAENPGTKYFYNNKIRSIKVPWGKSDPDGILRTAYTGCQDTTPYPSHTSSAIGNGDPWKLYNSEWWVGTENKSKGAGVGLWGPVNETGIPHEVYNCISHVTDNGFHFDDMDSSVPDQKYDSNFYDGGRFRRVDGVVFETLNDWQSSQLSSDTGWDKSSSGDLSGVTAKPIPSSWPSEINNSGSIGPDF